MFNCNTSTGLHLRTDNCSNFLQSPFVVGVLPNTLVTVQAGVTLAALASPDDFTLLTPQNIIMTVVVGVCLLLPIVLHRHVEDPTATPKADGSSEQEDPLSRV